jgi:hypothetical protein
VPKALDSTILEKAQSGEGVLVFNCFYKVQEAVVACPKVVQ